MEFAIILLFIFFLLGIRIGPHICVAIQESKHKELNGFDIDWQYIVLEEQKQKELERK